MVKFRRRVGSATAGFCSRASKFFWRTTNLGGTRGGYRQFDGTRRCLGPLQNPWSSDGSRPAHCVLRALGEVRSGSNCVRFATERRPERPGQLRDVRLDDAITKFDPGRGFKFETYAIARIKGAVLDELRSIDWVPRSVRAKAKSVERAMSKLESELHRAPTERRSPANST